MYLNRNCMFSLLSHDFMDYIIEWSSLNGVFLFVSCIFPLFLLCVCVYVRTFNYIFFFVKSYVKQDIAPCILDLYI